jgi:RNA polymerase sigma-70 factor (ECF subfamily)
MISSGKFVHFSVRPSLEGQAMHQSAEDAVRLLAAARAGSGEALGQALEACRDYLLLVADRELDAALRAKGGASDLVQETFLEAHRDFSGFHGNSADELRAWLRRLLLNNLADFARQYRGTAKRDVGQEAPLEAGDSSSERGAGLAADTPSPSGQAMANEQADALERAMRRLPDEYRQVLTLRHQEQLAFEEIGQQMQRTANAARMLWLRAVERLQEELGLSHDSGRTDAAR